MQTSDNDIAVLLKRQNELLEQLVRSGKGTHRATKTAAHISQRQGRLISLGLLWGIVLAVVLHLAVQTWIADLADTRVGRLLGIEPAQTSAVSSGSDQPLKQGAVVGDWVVTSGMGPRQSPGGVGSTNHQGIDLAHKTGPGKTLGHPLAAPFDTTVVCSSSRSGGVGATIDGPGVRLLMLHLSQCRPGAARAGQVIGNVGNTGNSTGPHLHIEQFDGGRRVNPTERWAAAVLGVRLSAPDGRPIPDDILKRAIGRAEGTRDRQGNPTQAFFGHRDPGWSGQCPNLGSFSYQHCADSPDEADRLWLVTLRKAEQDIQRQAQAKFGRPLSTVAMVVALDGYTQSPDAGERFVDHLAKPDPAPHELIQARTAALNASRLANGGPSMNVPADQRRRVNAILEQLNP